MSHEIQADSNTYVGYNFITSEFYIKNLDTKTAAKSANDAKLILDITAPGNTISLNEIQYLSQSLEEIETINYTLEDTGKYIKTIYFNDYKSLAMQYDEPCLYIRGSNEMWDMSSSLGIESVTDYMWQYYVYHVGLNVSRNLMTHIIKYFNTIQKPYVYNVITQQTQEEKDAGLPLMYSNEFIINNSNKEAKGEYKGTKNPDNLYSLNSYNVIQSKDTISYPTYKVSSIEHVVSRINLTELYPEGTFLPIPEPTPEPEEPTDESEEETNDENIENGDGSEEGDTEEPEVTPEPVTIRIINTDNADLNKEYTIERVVNDEPSLVTNPVTHIYVVEDIPVSYVPPIENTECLQKTTPEIINENSIVCDEEPECDVNDIIQVTGDGNEALTNYHVLKTEGRKIFTKEDITHNFAGENAKVWINAYQIQYMGYDNYINTKSSQQINQIDGNKVYIVGILKDGQYTAGETIYINYGNDIKEYTIEEVVPTKFTASQISVDGMNVSTPYTIRNKVIVNNVEHESPYEFSGKTSFTIKAVDNQKKIKLQINDGAEVVHNSPYTFTGVANTTYIAKIAEPVIDNSLDNTGMVDGYLVLNESLESYNNLLGSNPIFVEKREPIQTPENSLTLSECAPLKTGDTFDIFNTEIDGEYKVDSIEGNKIFIQKETDMEDIPPTTFEQGKGGIIQLRKYSERILLEMLFSKRADKMPMGKFMLDNNQQFTQYLEMYKIIPPTSTNYNNINQAVDLRYYLGNNLLLNTVNTANYRIFENKEMLKKFQGDSTRNKYAFVIYYEKNDPYFERYEYTGERINTITQQTEYVWKLSPLYTYMECQGLYSDNYENL